MPAVINAPPATTANQPSQVGVDSRDICGDLDVAHLEHLVVPGERTASEEHEPRRCRG